ncbi:MAG: D-alanyl-D-alanine carboxypeptidase family protein [Actinomycetota bacterium]
MTLRRTAAVLAVMALSMGWMLPATAAPLQIPDPPREGLPPPGAPTVSAGSWVLYDADAEMTLASHLADEERPMASTTKLMTAILTMKYGDLGDTVTVSGRAADVGEAEVGLVKGEQLPLRLLLTALVIRSANDAAVAVAEHISGSVEEFVELMNAEAEAMGLEHTHFDNPHGLDGESHYSSANDLLQMGLTAMAYPEFRQMAATIETEFPDAPDGTERALHSTNLMLETYPGTIGVKTGYTGQAGLVLVAGAAREGRTLFAVVMGSEGQRAHFSDAETLLDWGFSHYRSVAMVTSGTYQPPQPVRVETDLPPEPEPEPVVVTNVREVEEAPPRLLDALGWVGRWMARLDGG